MSKKKRPKCQPPLTQDLSRERNSRRTRVGFKQPESQYSCGFQPSSTHRKRPVISCCYQGAPRPPQAIRSGVAGRSGGAFARGRRGPSSRHPEPPGRAMGYLVAKPWAALNRDRHASGVVYLGPPAQTPALLFELVEVSRDSGMQAPPQLQVPAPHLRVVSRRERGKKLPYPARGREEAFPVPQGGAAVGRSGTR